MSYISRCPVVLFSLVLLTAACGSDPSVNSNGQNDSDDTGWEGETDTGTQTSSDDPGDTADTEKDSEPERTTDPEDMNEPPSDLAERCRLNTVKKAGEDVGRFEVSEGGDGRVPDIAVDSETGSALIVWGYFPPDSVGTDNRRWSIQASQYVVTVDGENHITSETGDIVQVTALTESPLAEQPGVALSTDGYVVVYRDARWDADCDPQSADGYENCRRSTALLTLDAEGHPTMTAPVRLSEGLARSRPAITRTPDGEYIAAWAELDESAHYVSVIRISSDMTPGELYRLPGTADQLDGPSIASNDRVTVIVYGIGYQDGVMAGIWPHDDTAPLENALVISDTFVNQYGPKIAAGDDGFMVSYNAMIAGGYEVFLQPLDADGELNGEPERGTWAYESVSGSELAWNGEAYAMVWESSTENGASAWPNPEGLDPDAICVYEGCNEQIFATLLDISGRVTSMPVLVSNDINRSQRPKIVWDSVGWTLVWQAWRKNRWQVFHGQMLCD